jgi:hypothetical protein
VLIFIPSGNFRIATSYLLVHEKRIVNLAENGRRDITTTIAA